MIGRRPWLGLVVLGGAFAALAALAGLILTAGGGTRPPSQALPQPAAATAQLVVPEAGTGTSRGTDGSRSGNRSASRVDPAWAVRTGQKAGIPAAAMIAYGSAELRMAREQRGCHLSWNTLAGIGWIESQHGTLKDHVLRADGTSEPPIIGPALNGQGFAAIRSTPESARWHGDPTWEHAVGPLQFIRSTWAKWGSDGDLDGTADPMDLDDASWTAARYLCADAHDLATVDGWNAAVHSYNHDNTYVVNVANAANTYAQRVSG